MVLAFTDKRTKPNPEASKRGSKRHTGCTLGFSKFSPKSEVCSPKALEVGCNGFVCISFKMQAHFACFATVELYLLTITIKLISIRASRHSRKLCHVLSWLGMAHDAMQHHGVGTEGEAKMTGCVEFG